MWIILKYERLPDVCFWCGSLGHIEAYCEKERATLSNEFGFKFPAFRDWLKADNDKIPPGIYEHPSERQPSVDLGSGVLPSAIFEVAELDIRTREVAVQNDIPLLIAEDACTAKSPDSGCSTSAEVLSFALLLEQNLKDECPASSTWSPHKTTDESNRYVPPHINTLDARPVEALSNLCPTSPNITQTSLNAGPIQPSHNEHICGPNQATSPVQAQAIMPHSPHNLNTQMTQNKPIKSIRSTEAAEAHPSPSQSSFNNEVLESFIPNTLSSDTLESLSPNNSPHSSSTPNTSLKRKDHPVSPHTDPKKPRPENTFAEASFFEHDDLEHLEVSSSFLISGDLVEELGIDMPPPAP